MGLIKGIIDVYFCKVQSVLEELKYLAKQFKHWERGEQHPFNIFLVSSDRYFYENLHSELLAALLRRSDFRHRFIDWLNTFSKLNNPNGVICKDNYIDFKVQVEAGKIDVSLESEMSQHCIIIENKINNALDMDRQIPRYVERQKGKKYIVDAIVYLSIDGVKSPCNDSWTPSEIDEINSILICVAASNSAANGADNGADMVGGFLEKCISDTTTLQEYCFISQYIDLLKFLGRNQMDEDLMRQFYDKMREGDNYQAAKSIRSMLDKLIEYRCMRLLGKFSAYKDIFSQVFAYGTPKRIVVFERLPRFPDASVANERVKIHVECENSERTRIRLWVQDCTTHDDIIEKLLGRIKLFEKFTRSSLNDYYTDFSFP